MNDSFGLAAFRSRTQVLRMEDALHRAGPVSYTHLDVYKRQSTSRLMMASSYNEDTQKSIQNE